MMLAGFLFLLLLTDGVSSEHDCSLQNILNYLNLTNNKDLFSMSRPVKNYTEPTEVELSVLLNAILDVREKDQKCVSYALIEMFWENEFISWDPEAFCGIRSISLPAELFWKPDIIIEEMTEKDKGSPSPYLTVYNNGYIGFLNEQVLVTTCRMQIYRFPFDIQRCNLTFKSIIHSVDEIKFVDFLGSKMTTEFTHLLIQTEYEWLFLNTTVTNTTTNMFGFKQSIIVYTITMERKSGLYIVNFLLPALFFLCLDLASFLIPDSGGEKLSFKVTVLLAVTVLQLILNEILPATSDRIPLISVYCVGIFGLMMLSLLETILVMYLMDKDSASQDNEANLNKRLGEVCGDRQSKVCFRNWFRDTNKLTHSASDVPPSETFEMLSVAKEESSSQFRVESHEMEKLSDELRDAQKKLAAVLNNRKEEQKPDYWTRMAKTINKVYFICYVIAAALFLIVMFSIWTSE